MPANRALSGRNSAMTTPASFEAALSAPSFDSRPRATTPISHAHASQAADSRADSASTMPHQSFCEDGKKWSPPVGYVPQPKSAKRDAENRKRLAVERRDESIPQEEEDSLAALILDTYAPAGEFRDLQPRTLRAFHHGHVPLLCGCFRLNWRGIELYHFNVFRCGYHCLERFPRKNADRLKKDRTRPNRPVRRCTAAVFYPTWRTTGVHYKKGQPSAAFFPRSAPGKTIFLHSLLAHEPHSLG